MREVVTGLNSRRGAAEWTSAADMVAAAEEAAAEVAHLKFAAQLEAGRQQSCDAEHMEMVPPAWSAFIEHVSSSDLGQCPLD